jgi:hypothetical protein
MAVAPLIPVEETRSDSGARWEMVVPKMVRPDRAQQETAGTAAPAQYRRDDTYLPISIPTASDSRNPFAPSLSRVFAALGRRTRSLWSGPSQPVDTTPISFLDAQRLALESSRSSRVQVLQLNAPSFSTPARNQLARIEDVPGRHARREPLLSKIASTLDNHRGSIEPALAIGHRDKPGSIYSI